MVFSESITPGECLYTYKLETPGDSLGCKTSLPGIDCTWHPGAFRDLILGTGEDNDGR